MLKDTLAGLSLDCPCDARLRVGLELDAIDIFGL
jgi:hypothetical protein